MKKGTFGGRQGSSDGRINNGFTLFGGFHGEKLGFKRTRKQREKLRVWEQWHPMPEPDKPLLSKLEAETRYCCQPVDGDNRCGKLSYWRVRWSGFCKDHKAEAFQAQQAYWAWKVKYFVKEYHKYS